VEPDKRREHDKSSKRYLEKVAHAYILDGTGSIYKPKTESTQQNTEKTSYGSRKTRPLWVNIIRDWPVFLVSLGTLVFLIATLHYARKQWLEANRSAGASEKAANAAADAATTAKNSLDLTRQEFLSSEAAALQPVVSVRSNGQVAYIQVDILNVGHRAATHVDGIITLSRLSHVSQSARLKGMSITERAVSPDYPSGFVSRTFLLGSPLDIKALADQYPRVDTRFHYWNGIGDTKQSFSSCLTISLYTETPNWQDCENQKAFQQHVR
jgi:hypothetical protein